VVPSAVIDIVEIVFDITAEYSGSLYRNASRYCVGQNIIGLKAIGTFY
jgi:hypothetical protein